MSVRDFQNRTLQWLQGKTFESSTPVGPWLVTSDEAPGPSREITCEVGGELMQQADTADLVFDPATLVAYISDIFTLEPGDIIATGTPGGVGAARTPPRFLADGDEVVTRIAGVGECRNRCRKERLRELSPNFSARSRCECALTPDIVPGRGDRDRQPAGQAEKHGKRASAMSPDDRRSSIVAATLPLLLEHGEMATTRQIAEAAGVAEGTIFRAFADKDELIAAVVEAAMDREPLEAALAAIDRRTCRSSSRSLRRPPSSRTGSSTSGGCARHRPAAPPQKPRPLASPALERALRAPP